jgi:hypothetical protein
MKSRPVNVSASPLQSLIFIPDLRSWEMTHLLCLNASSMQGQMVDEGISSLRKGGTPLGFGVCICELPLGLLVMGQYR